MKRKTTRKDFEEYRAAVEKWLGVFGIKDWCVTFKHEDDENFCAWTVHNPNARNVGFGLSKEYDDDFNQSMDELAFHEVCHLLLAPLSDLIDRREFSTTQNTIEEHRIIHMLQKIVQERG